MKHLRIEVNGLEYVNGDFAEVSFTDGINGVRLEAKSAPTPAAGGGGASLLDLLASLSKARPAEVTPTEPVTVSEAPVVEEPVQPVEG